MLMSMCEMLTSWGNVWMTVGQPSIRRSYDQMIDQFSDDLGWGHKLWPVADSWNILYVLPMHYIVRPYIFTLYMMFYLNFQAIE